MGLCPLKSIKRPFVMEKNGEPEAFFTILGKNFSKKQQYEERLAIACYNKNMFIRAHLATGNDRRRVR